MRTSMAVVCALAAWFASAARADDRTECRPEILGSATVLAVIDGRTVSLSDGREVRLAGIEIANDSDNREAARAALEKHVIGQEVRLLRMGVETDRYGRVVAGMTGTADEKPVQLELLAQGHALVASQSTISKTAGIYFYEFNTSRLTKGLYFYQVEFMTGSERLQKNGKIIIR